VANDDHADHSDGQVAQRGGGEQWRVVREWAHDLDPDEYEQEAGARPRGASG